MKFSRILSLFLALVIALSLTPAMQAETLEFTDMADRAIKLDKAVTRIVALQPADCEVLFAIGAGDLLELKGPGKRPVLIPFSEAAVLEIDLEGGRLLVDPIAAGLKDDGEEKPYGNAGGKPRPNNGR